jgi:hypothetical protein
VSSFHQFPSKFADMTGYAITIDADDADQERQYDATYSKRRAWDSTGRTSDTKSTKRPRMTQDQHENSITHITSATRIKAEPSENAGLVPRARDIKVTFIDENGYIRRERLWHQCHSSENLFAHALAAGLLVSHADVNVLKANVGELELPLVQGDKGDFDELGEVLRQQRVVKREDGGSELESGLVVEVRRL